MRAAGTHARSQRSPLRQELLDYQELRRQTHLRWTTSLQNFLKTSEKEAAQRRHLNTIRSRNGKPTVETHYEKAAGDPDDVWHSWRSHHDRLEGFRTSLGRDALNGYERVAARLRQFDILFGQEYGIRNGDAHANATGGPIGASARIDAIATDDTHGVLTNATATTTMSPPRPTAGPFRTPHTPLPPAPADYNLEQIIAARETADLDAAVQRSLQRYLLGRRQPERDCSWEDEGTAGLWWASVWMVCMVLYDVLSSQDKTSQLLSRKTKRSPLLSSPVQTSQLLSSPAETSQATSRQARDRPSKAKKRPSWARWGWSLILMLLACCYLLYSYRTQHGPSVTGGRVATAQRDSAADASSWDGVKWEDIRHLYRLTWDYRRPNKHLLGATHPLPDLEDCVQILHGAQWFAVIDLVDGYTQCQLSPESREMFSVATHDGVYTPTRVPMGAACSPSWFQAQMERAFAPILRRGALLYLDDLLIYATSFEQLMERLHDGDVGIGPS
eukprot:GHVU01191440.1.p1 GENE.GHVU01191440.1~~GHVU01191440.1.p1  ORF type:complete len:511 (+),score=35.53 GHVU01191440.1:31-1533(+)